MDCRLELFVVVSPNARGNRTDIQLALILAEVCHLSTFMLRAKLRHRIFPRLQLARDRLTRRSMWSSCRPSFLKN